MYIRPLLTQILRVILPLAFVATFYLYLYPVFHGCAFISIHDGRYQRDGNDLNNLNRRGGGGGDSNGVRHLIKSYRDTLVRHLPRDRASPGGVEKNGDDGPRLGGPAPFRLLVLADPQIEGDSSLPKGGNGFVGRLRGHWERVLGLDPVEAGTSGLQGVEHNVLKQQSLEEEHTLGGGTGESSAIEGKAEKGDAKVEDTATTTMQEAGSSSDPNETIMTAEVVEDRNLKAEGFPVEPIQEAAATEGVNAMRNSEPEDKVITPGEEESTSMEDGNMPAGRTKEADTTVNEETVVMAEPEEAVGLRTEKAVTNPPREVKSSGRLTQAWEALQTICRKDIPDTLYGAYKRLDLLGNDYYLAHIYRTLNWWTIPSHVTVLGDLIGSQWVKDDEFERRGWRYWNRLMAGGERIGEEITTLQDEKEEKVFQIDDPSWKRKVINIAGNHDIGYAGDISEARLERFERVFGKANWDVRFEYPAQANATSDDEKPPSIHLINLNSLVLDTPALAESIQSATYDYMNSVITNRLRPVEDKTSFTLMLTHVPLFKKAGICVDAPKFEFWGNDDGGGAYRPRGLKEQNHLSRHASEPGMLESMFGMKGDVAAAGQGKGRHGLILNGHDHEGCDTWHFVHINRTWNSSEGPATDRKTQWMVSRIEDADSDATHAGLREITLRSMMGEFAGNAGLLSAWYDFEQKSWRYEFQTCKLGVQHVWWAVHILDLVVLGMVICWGFTKAVPVSVAQPKYGKHTKSNGTAEKKK